MAYISTEFRLAFFAAPATGSSAVIKALQDHGIGQYWPPDEIVRDGKRITPMKHSTFDQLKAASIESKIEGFVKAVGVRNVFSWHVAKFLRNRTSRQRNLQNKKSWIYTRLTEYERKKYISTLNKQKNMTFGEYLHSIMDHHTSVDFHEAFHRDMDVYLHQERLERDFRELSSAVGIPHQITVPSYNVTGAMKAGETYKDFYEPDLVEFVYEKNAPFFARFPEYSFDGLA